MANITPEVVLRILFPTLNNANVDFLGWELWWKTYTIKKALLTIKCVELVGKKEFAAALLDPEHKTFIVHIASLSSIPLNARLQISGLIVKEAPTKVSAKYLDFADVFSLGLASELPKHTWINNHAIELVDG